MAFDPVSRLLGRPISHVGYVVDDIPSAVEQWSRAGVGPFFIIEHPVFDSVESEGEPAVFDHSGAFAWWGNVGLELHEITTIEPSHAGEKLGVGKGNVVNHVAIESPSPEEDSARLEELGMPLFLLAKFGPIEDRMHYAPFLGHVIELHRQSDALDQHWRTIAAAAEGWDGTDPLRTLDALS